MKFVIKSVQSHEYRFHVLNTLRILTDGFGCNIRRALFEAASAALWSIRENESDYKVALMVQDFAPVDPVNWIYGKRKSETW